MAIEPFDDFTNGKIRVFLVDCSKYFLLNFEIFRSIQRHPNIGAHKNDGISRNKPDIEQRWITVNEISYMLAVQLFGGQSLSFFECIETYGFGPKPKVGENGRFIARQLKTKVICIRLAEFVD